MRWNRHPFILITPMFIAGILLENYFRSTESHTFQIVLFFSAILALSIIGLTSQKLNRKSLAVNTFLVSIILLGHLTSHLSWYHSKPDIANLLMNNSEYFTAVIDSKPHKTLNSTRYEVTVSNVGVEGDWENINAKAILYSLDNIDFTYGDILLIQGKLQVLENQKNPHAFDYTKYLQRKGIFLQGYCSAGNYAILQENHFSSSKYLTLRIGDFFEQILEKYISSERELNMVKAMVIGRRDNITPEMEYVYESTGTSHILAVSGLHVGIIYLMISTIFKFMKRGRLRWIYYTIAILGIWSFAMITGFSPSVRRAALMFTFILFAEMIGRKNAIYNSIFASAFCLLLFTPNLIFSVSFQFSYVAVLGIIYLYKKIYVLVYVKNRFINFFWKITVLAISVQIATFPINIYYFQQFPALFPITNLFAIPTASVVIFGSLAIFVTSFMSYLPDYIGVILKWWVYIYNEILKYLSSWDITSIEGLSLKTTYVFLIMILVFLLIRFIEIRRLYLLTLFTVILCVLTTLVIIDHHQKSNQEIFTLYSVKNRFYYDVFLGKSCYSNNLGKDDISRKDVFFNLGANRDYHLIDKLVDIDQLKTVQSLGKNQLFYTNGKWILVFNEPYSITDQIKNVELDFLIIGKNAVRYLDFIKSSIYTKNLILDGTISGQDKVKIESVLPVDWKIHDSIEDGPLILGI